MCKAVPIKNFPDYYITDSGLVYSRNPYKNRDGRIKRIKTVQRKTGYINVGLNRNNKHFVLPLHRLVAMAFVPNPDNKPEVNHINGVKHDNRADNLEWVTHSENIKHSYTTLGKKRNPHFNVYRKWVACIKDGKIIDKFHGTREASRQTGIRQARISECCLGKTKHAGGFQWEYIDGDWKDSLMKCGEKK